MAFFFIRINNAHISFLTSSFLNSGDNVRPSITSVCASMDAKASRYAASIRIQSARTEIIADLGNMVKELLKAFYKTCSRKPERILFYRDGVSEGQFNQVMNAEINAVRGTICCYSIYLRSSLNLMLID